MRKLGMVLLVVLSVAACSNGGKTLEEGSGTTATTATTVDDTFPEEGVTTTSKPVAKKLTVGQGGTLYDNDTKKDVLKVLVTKVEFSGGDEFNKPERGVYLGVYVKVKALANDQNSLAGDFYVVMRGHHYDADACCVDRFEPTLDYVDLNEGETAEGWQMYDVPARHGVVVLGQSFGGGKSLSGRSERGAMNTPKVGTCYCGCGRATNGHFAQGHDARAASMLEHLHGHSDTAERLLLRGYGPGGENLEAKAKAAGWKSRAES